MPHIVIKAEELGKKYIIGHLGRGSYKTFREQMMQHLHNFYSRTRQLFTGQQVVEGDEVEEFWALKDLYFEIEQGDRVGIIGRNGAGKSTLLKILSRITEPTNGKVSIRGRVASLLEVGTGFHPELTGRENIFLNGAILGMSRAEIKRKFDEIVDFSGVEKFLDTPVKRYSSGMYVRLAFSVAAHLEPEILVVDEVLAVGDAEFQKKCLGKMQDVSATEGRTVLFVSHNMTAIQSLCNRGILLKNGSIIYQGDAGSTVHYYLKQELAPKTKVEWTTSRPGDEVAEIISARLVNEKMESIDFVRIDEKAGIEYEYRVKKEGFRPVPNIHIYTTRGECVFVAVEPSNGEHAKTGRHKTTVWIPAHLLNKESYYVNLVVTTFSPFKVHFTVEEAINFDVIENVNTRDTDFKHDYPGVVRPKLTWQSNLIQ